jgi:hypothetical protein
VSSKGFFASLFDLTFTSLITTKIIKIVYLLSLIAIGLTALLFVIAAFRVSGAFGAVTLFILAPLAALFYAIYTRVALEFVITVFRIAEYNRDAVLELRAARGSVQPATPQNPQS